jgi:hypothetical protein
MKSLYDGIEKTPEYFQLQEIILAAITPIMKQYIELGFSPMEISHAIQHEIQSLEIHIRLDIRKKL